MEIIPVVFVFLSNPPSSMQFRQIIFTQASGRAINNAGHRPLPPSSTTCRVHINFNNDRNSIALEYNGDRANTARAFKTIQSGEKETLFLTLHCYSSGN